MTSVGAFLVTFALLLGSLVCVLAGIIFIKMGLLAWQDRRDDLLAACADARKLGEIAELELAYRAPSAPDWPWTR